MITLRFQSVRLALIVALMVLVSARALGGVTTISLRSTVRISSDESVTLGQLGTIEGDQAALLGELEVEELLTGEPGQWQQLRVAELRELLEREPGLHAGSVVIDGSGVSLRRSDPSKRTALSTVKSATSEESIHAGPVLRDHVERWVRDRYRIGQDLMRMSFRNHDDAFLNTSTTDRLVEIKEISKRGRTAIRVIVLENLEVAAEQALVFDVEIFRTVLVSRQRVNRGTVLDDSMVMTERRWVSPDDEAARIDAAIGMAVSKTINAGQLIKSQHIELPLVIRRGDIVSAKSIAGSVVVTVRGRAKANARLGETLEIESMNGENQFRARATGKGRAAILHGGSSGDQS
jgi:flagella basal body P-ring formation protein FlgA